MKNLRFLIIGSIFLFFSACSYQLDKKEAPDDLIPQDTFTMILQDVMIVESYFKHQQNNVNDFADVLTEAIHPIFVKYNTDSLQYSHSMEYYASHPIKLTEIYNQIQDSITINTADYGN